MESLVIIGPVWTGLDRYPIVLDRSSTVRIFRRDAARHRATVGAYAPPFTGATMGPPGRSN